MKLLSYFTSGLITCLAAGPAYGGTCVSPAGNEADIVYNSAYHTYQFCNGTSWMAYGGGGTCTPASSGYSPTVPSGNGYFVLSHGTYNGNLGGTGPAGVDATCLTDLTTNTGWIGYSTANSNGQLVADKVHAFICQSAYCGNLIPLTTYYFANALNSSAGGASFTTDSIGDGPNDSADWAAANYFSGTYDWWSARASFSNTAWQPTWDTLNTDCTNWTTSSGATFGNVGVTANTTNLRWSANGSAACSTTLHIICLVNP